jgi:hypothetical protein
MSDTYGRPLAPSENKPLICDPEAIFQEDGFIAAFKQARTNSDPVETRKEIVGWLR